MCQIESNSGFWLEVKGLAAQGALGPSSDRIFWYSPPETESGTGESGDRSTLPPLLLLLSTPKLGVHGGSPLIRLRVQWRPLSRGLTPKSQMVPSWRGASASALVAGGMFSIEVNRESYPQPTSELWVEWNWNGDYNISFTHWVCVWLCFLFILFYLYFSWKFRRNTAIAVG